MVANRPSSWMRASSPLVEPDRVALGADVIPTSECAGCWPSPCRGGPGRRAGHRTQLGPEGGDGRRRPRGRSTTVSAMRLRSGAGEELALAQGAGLDVDREVAFAVPGGQRSFLQRGHCIGRASGWARASMLPPAGPPTESGPALPWRPALPGRRSGGRSLGAWRARSPEPGAPSRSPASGHAPTPAASDSTGRTGAPARRAGSPDFHCAPQIDGLLRCPWNGGQSEVPSPPFTPGSAKCSAACS
jgi:hypothetical protein